MKYQKSKIKNPHFALQASRGKQNYNPKFKIFYILLLIPYLLSHIFYLPVFAQEATDSAQPTIQFSPTPSPVPQIPADSQDSTTSAEPSIRIQDHLDSMSGKIIFDKPGNAVDLSAKFKTPSVIKKLSKANYMADEAVILTVENTTNKNTEIKVFDRDNSQIIVTTETIHEIDPTVIKINPPQNFKPGKYRLNIKDPDGKELNQDFTWGVLAINTNKSYYLPNETAQISLAVLDNNGNMVCDAKVTLDIKDPSGVSKILSTEDSSITRNSECFIKDFTLKPDYQTQFQTGLIGVYDMNLKAETYNGIYSVTDNFEVKDEVAFDIERQSATRIYPPKIYPMNITLTANQDFQGIIREIVPTDFSIATLEGTLAYKESKIIQSSQAKNEINENELTIIYPFSGNYEITSEFGVEVEDPLLKIKYNDAGLIGHDGLDFALPSGTPILAVDDGFITYIGDEPYGKTIIIQHSWGKSYYGHLQEVLFQTNDSINVGDKIALSGSTGLSTGPHLHFGLRLNQFDPSNGFYGKINPLPYLNSTSFVTNPESVQLITWEVDLKKGDQIELGYNYKASQKSPEFHLIGPLTLYQYYGSDLLHIFQESRHWQIAADALSFSNLGTNADPDINDGTDRTSYCNGGSAPPCSVSWTPPTSGLIVLYVYSREAAGLNTISSVTGNSITWTEIKTLTWGPSSLHRLTLFGANASGSTSGATTISYGANTQLGLAASFFHVTGVDLCEGVSNAFVQSPTNSADTGFEGTVTLASAADSNNRPIVAFFHAADETTTPRTNWTELDDLTGLGPVRGLETQYRGDAFETTATATWSTDSRWGGIAAELKMEPTSPNLDQLLRHGGWFKCGVEQPFTF